MLGPAPSPGSLAPGTLPRAWAVLAVLVLVGSGAMAGLVAASGGGPGGPAVPALPHPSAVLPSGPSPHRPLTTLSGIDVSSYQGGSIDWATVYADGNDFAFARAVEYYGTPDPDFDTNMANGNAAGVYMGAYDFVYPASETASTDADYFNSVIKTYVADGYMYPALDLEEDCTASGGTLDAAQITTWVNAWATELETDLAGDGFSGVVPIIYMNSNYASNCIDASTWGGWNLWIAEYYNTCATSPAPSTGVLSSYQYWQWCSSGSSGGIDPVDQDLFNGDLAQLQSGFIFGDGGPVVSYAVQDLTTNTAEYCGGTFAAGDSIQFTATVTGGTSPYTYAWTFGDGGAGSTNPVTHVYTAAGSVNPLLTVTDAKGLQGTTGSSCDFTVTAPSSVTVSFAIAPNAAGSAILEGTTSYTNGQSATLAPSTSYPIGATVPAGYAFASWSASGTISIASKTSSSTTMTPGVSGGTLTLNLEPQVTVTFESLPTTVGGITFGGTTYTNGQTDPVATGSQGAITAIVPGGWSFVDWTVSGGLSVLAADNPSTTLDVASSGGFLTAVYVQDANVTVDVSPPSAGVVTVGTASASNGQVLVLEDGQSYALSAPTAPAGTSFVGWSVNGSSLTVTPVSDPVASLTVLNPSGGTLTATFAGLLPLAPTGLQVTGVAVGSVSLSWQAPPGTVVNSTVYTTEGSSTAPTGAWKGTNVVGTGTTATVGGLALGSTYWFEVTAWNSTGQGPSSSRVSAPLLLPGAPTDLLVVSNAATWANLSWRAPEGGATVLSFSLTIAPAAGGSTKTISVGGTTSTASATGLTEGAAYTFQVFAVGSLGTGPGSNLVNLTLSGGSSGGGGGSGSGVLPSWFPGASLGIGLLAVIAVVVVAAIAGVVLAGRRRKSRGGDPSEGKPLSPYAPPTGYGVTDEVAPGPPPP